MGLITVYIVRCLGYSYEEPSMDLAIGKATWLADRLGVDIGRVTISPRHKVKG